MPEQFTELNGARIAHIEYGITNDGDSILLIYTDRGVYEVSAVAWSDILASITEGGANDITTHVSISKEK